MDVHLYLANVTQVTGAPFTKVALSEAQGYALYGGVGNLVRLFADERYLNLKIQAAELDLTNSYAPVLTLWVVRL